MLDEYICRGGQRLRCGYTTGSCAAAAAKAAAQMLLTGQMCDMVRINTPKGITLNVETLHTQLTPDSARCGIMKDGGDDPDVTSGLIIFADVRLTDNGISINGGEGVGVVTKEGLDQPVGAAAINSVPRRMIAEEVTRTAEACGYKGGFDITISVLNGEEIAKKTFNPRMGIVGGISIIGTSGIVEPMSSAALVDTIKLEMKQRRAEGHKTAVLTQGNYSRAFLAQSMPAALEKSIKCSNFIGDSIDLAAGCGFDGALIIGHIAKLVKLGAGIMNTHSSFADGRMDVLISCALAAGADIDVLKKISDCTAVDAALETLISAGYIEKTLGILSIRVQDYLDARVRGSIKLGAVMFSDKHNLTVKTKSADELIKRIAEEYNG